jgi:hypothetical protein
MAGSGELGIERCNSLFGSISDGWGYVCNGDLELHDFWPLDGQRLFICRARGIGNGSRSVNGNVLDDDCFRTNGDDFNNDNDNDTFDNDNDNDAFDNDLAAGHCRTRSA